MSDAIKKLADLFAKFPTVGHRTASRFVFYLLKLPKQEIDELTSAIQELKDKIKFCIFCFNPYEPAHASKDQENLCFICQNPSRNRQLLCVVEKESDLISIENTKRYNGLYFVLGNSILYFKKNDSNSLRINELKERIKNPQKFGLPMIYPVKSAEGGVSQDAKQFNGVNFTEIIIATNPTPEGKATSVLIERELKEIPQTPAFKITHLAKGLPVGGELEYADEETLESAFEGRK